MPRVTPQDVILEILRVADGEWTGKTKLYKAFYFAHLYYANERPGLLTDWPIARMPEGPGIHQGDRLLNAIAEHGFLTVELSHEGPYPENRYRLTDKAGQVPRPPADASSAIKDAANFCLPRTATELSQLTHERSRSWKLGRDGDLLNIYIDTIPDDEYQRRQDELARLEANFGGLLEEGQA